MSVLVRVVRQPGDKPAPDIIDPLCTTNQVAIERGRVFLDSNYRNKVAIDGNGPFFEWLPPGKLADIIDHELGSYSSQIISSNISIVRNEYDFQVDVNLKLERLDDQE